MPVSTIASVPTKNNAARYPAASYRRSSRRRIRARSQLGSSRDRRPYIARYASTTLRPSSPALRSHSASM